MSETVLVTGAAGFIGSAVSRALVQRGVGVVGVDNFDPYYARLRKEMNVKGVRDAARPGLETATGRDARGSFELVEADICDSAVMRSVFTKHRPSGVIHLAARAGVRPSISDPVTYSRVNVMGTSVILEAAREAGVKRTVIASSSSVYGNCPTAPFSEEMDVSTPISPYAATKRACELIGHTHWHLTKMPTAMLRFFTVYGPAQRPDLAIANFLERVGRGEEIVVYGRGETSRDYTFIDDIVAGVLAAYDRIPAHGYRIWNLGNSSPVTLEGMIATIERVVGRKALMRHEPASAGDVERTFADLTRSGAELGFRPAVKFEDGVARQWAWMRASQ